MNTRTALVCASACAALGVLASPALAGRAIPNHPSELPPIDINQGKTIPGWGIIDFELDDSDWIGTVPHSDGLEPPSHLGSVVGPISGTRRSLGDPASGVLWSDRDDSARASDSSIGVGVITPNPVSAVPAPGSVVLLVGAAALSARRRRH